MAQADDDSNWKWWSAGRRGGNNARDGETSNSVTPRITPRRANPARLEYPPSLTWATRPVILSCGAGVPPAPRAPHLNTSATDLTDYDPCFRGGFS